jgi:GNAT superfamily N-acetyltransferase
MTRIVAGREVKGVTFRRAVPADTEAIEAVMRVSVRELSRGFYEEAHVPSVERSIATLDVALVEDGTYFVGEAAGRIVACGGWSRRDKLFTGGGERAGGSRLLDAASEPARVRAMFVHPEFARRGLGRAILDLCEDEARAEQFRRLELMATLPGVPLYLACGFSIVERVTITLPDGVEVGGVRMEKTLE